MSRTSDKMKTVDDFTFYMKLAKPLVLNLPNAKDRAMSALWLKKLSDVHSQSVDNTSEKSDKTHLEFLKLMLLAMQTNHLTGIFEAPPPTGDLQELLETSQNKPKAKDMTFLLKSVKTSVLGEKVVVTCHPSVMTSIGCDMCEYVAVQEIPGFGIHGYYALSNEPLSKWTTPRSYGPIEAKVSTACFKHTCEPMLGDVTNKEKEKTVENKTDDTEASASQETTKKKQEITKHSRKSLQKIYQSQRSEIAGVETRPCWGRSRYIERLIDESPHVVGDLDLTTADAMLTHYRDTKYRKVKSTEDGRSLKTCTVSSRRREAELRLNNPPCAPIIIEEEFRYVPESEETGSRICVPKSLECPRNTSDDEELDVDSCDFVDDEDDVDRYTKRDCENWPNYVLEARNANAIQRGKNDEPMWMLSEPEAVSDSRILIADPRRRAPPCHETKIPRRKEKSVTSHQTHSRNETFNPPGHSTRIGQ